MQVFLSKQCKSLTGSLGRGFGYYLQERKGNFYAIRQRGYVPENGHINFIITCAKIAQFKLHITDVKVDWLELQTALYEAKCFVASEQVRRNYADKCKVIYDARDILNLKTTFGL